MDSRITQLEQLRQEANAFTFDNFSIRHGTELKYGGTDTPKWLAWKTRVYNTIQKIMSDDSSALNLARVGLSIKLKGITTLTNSNRPLAH